MAGDWIKMRLDLQSHPKIVRILSATQSDKFRVIGGLHAVWSVFDTHSESGELRGYTPELMDHVIGWPGFSGAMLAVGWLSFDGEETLTMPEFDEHNGKSAKRRAEDQKRKRDGRKQSDDSPEISGQNADKKRTREEKRRYINPLSEYSDDFERFWAEYPKKTGKGGAWTSWKKQKPPVDGVLSALSWQRNSREWTKDGGQYVPMPQTYLNQRRWEDDPGGQKSSNQFAGAV